MVTGRTTAAASISERRRHAKIGLGGTIRSLLSATGIIGLLFLLAVAPVRAAAAEVYVQQDATPLVSRPGIGGKILTWVDTGFPLVVIGIEGEWLKVSSPQLKLSADLWVPLARVGRTIPGQLDIAFRPEAPLPEAFSSGFRLRAEGTPDTRFRARCLVDHGSSDDVVDFVDHVPADVGLDGHAVDCEVRQLSPTGRMHVALLRGDGVLIAGAPPIGIHQSARLRSGGRSGQAAGLHAPAGLAFHHTPVVVRQPLPSGFVPPLGNPVPALGNPVPFLGNPVPPLGNPVPALGNPVPPFVGARAPLR